MGSHAEIELPSKPAFTGTRVHHHQIGDGLDHHQQGDDQGTGGDRQAVRGQPAQDVADGTGAQIKAPVGGRTLSAVIDGATDDALTGLPGVRRTDSLVYVARARPTDPGWVTGAKPAAFARWLFGLLGAQAGDQLVDLFPGSGGIARAWTAYTAGVSEPSATVL